jgi:L-ascorbate metabolism protein UlaG (beta-lactamase superfamily)
MTESSNYTATRLGIPLNTVRYLLITHAHPDHFTANEIWKRLLPDKYKGLSVEDFENKISAPRITSLKHLDIYGNKYVFDEIKKASSLEGPLDTYDATFHRLKNGSTVVHNDLEFTAVNSHHASKNFALNYIIKRGGKTILYALDTGGYDDDVLNVLLSMQYDLIIMEATSGLIEGENYSHMSLTKIQLFFELLAEKQSIRKDTQLIVSHLSPHWTPPYDVVAPMLAKKRIGVAYDGQIIEI